jgi:sigma-B regulation protein RsbU (phosphoserine phosphatase)
MEQGVSKLLWVGPSPVPPNVRAAAAGGFSITAWRPGEPLGPQLSRCGVAMVCPNGQSDNPARLAALLDHFDRSPAIGIFLLPPHAQAAWATLTSRQGQFVCLREDAAAGEIAAALAAASALQPTILHLRGELAEALAVHNVPTTSDQLDEEMRLAARLQRDFLPRRLPEVGPARFSVLYRPASWVSGDIYDVARLDETHVGFYVADVVGHGMPAALLTMFIKKALTTKRIVGNTYQIVPPDVSLAELNADICRQNLSSCHFCTALYCVLDTAAMSLTYCRAGHPEPIVVAADGSVRRVGGAGSLLGIFEEEKFGSSRLELHRGDRVVLFTDGAEDCLRTPTTEHQPLEQLMADYIRSPREELMLRLTAELDRTAGRFRPLDDVTVMVVDIMP